VIVDVSLTRVVLLFVGAWIVVAMSQLVVIVLMRVPIDTMLDAAIRLDMVRDMPVIMRVDHGGMGMFGLRALPFHSLGHHGCPPFRVPRTQT
jgi:hypothetical protein